MANPRFVGARLRKGFDDDLLNATKHLDGNSKSELIRVGLRMALQITTQKVMMVREVPVAAPKIFKGGIIK